MNNKLSLTKDQIDELVFNKKSEVKMKDKLKVKVWNYKNVVLYEVLEQDESLRNDKIEYEANNGLKLIREFFPELDYDNNRLYIQGELEEDDNIVDACKMNTVEEAEQFVEKVKQAVKEFNESQNQILTDKEKEYLSAVIKPYRNRVKYITKKNRECDEKEYIGIYLCDDNLPLPYFTKGTMYKGMEVNKHYTLEELGLQEE